MLNQQIPLAILYYTPHTHVRTHTHKHTRTLTHNTMMKIDVLRPLLQAKWAERSPKVMRRSKRRNNLQICPRRDWNNVVMICGPTRYRQTTQAQPKDRHQVNLLSKKVAAKLMFNVISVISVLVKTDAIPVLISIKMSVRNHESKITDKCYLKVTD